MAMRLEGIHHITAITADARANLDFYTRVLGLRLVKKSVNQDDPTAYHLFYSDEHGSPGADLTFFEYPGATRGRPGLGMVYNIVWRVGSAAALDFWTDRLRRVGMTTARSGDTLNFEDPEGLGLTLAIVTTSDEPLIAAHPEIPREVALLGFDGVRAYSADPETSRGFLEHGVAFQPRPEISHRDTYEARGSRRGSFYAYDRTDRQGTPGAGTVHHVAWSSTMEEHEAWRRRVLEAGGRPTPVIDRYYFRSIYFREPSGVLFEIATMGPGFTADEPVEHLGERLALPPNYEPLRERLERVLTPLPNPRERWVRR
jgi:glyoxalase family protein